MQKPIQEHSTHGRPCPEPSPSLPNSLSRALNKVSRV